jgi:heme-degrading monooxygenase HmoA
MFISIRKYKVEGSMDELNRRVREEFVPIIRQLPGFKGYHLMDCGGGYIASVSMFESKEVALASSDRARDWVARSIKDLIPNPPELMSGETSLDVPA